MSLDSKTGPASGRQGFLPPFNRDDRRLLTAVAHCLAQATGQPVGVPGAAPVAIGVAFSGGRDSTVLLELAARLRQRASAGTVDLVAIHVHHGLQVQSDAWARHCEVECAARGVEYILCRTRVVGRGRGVEDAARQARYGALADTAARRRLALVMTAHHRDDRIETFLLQWLRGAGPAGLAGAAAVRRLAADPSGPVRPARGRTLDGAGVVASAPAALLLRPLLDVERAAIDRFAARHQLRHVDDPSNHAPVYARNRLRATVLPQLAQIRPGYLAAAARSIDLIADMAQLALELADADLAASLDATGALQLDRLRALSPPRRAAVMRAWLARAGIEAPSRARLAEALRQLLEPRKASNDAAPRRFALGRREIERNGNCLSIGGAMATGSASALAALGQSARLG